MASKKQEVVNRLRIVVERMKDLGPIGAEGWGGSVQFIFPDLKTGWLMKFAMDGTIESWDEKIDEESANGVVEMDSDVFLDVWEKKLSPLQAMSEHKLVTRKEIDALFKLMPALM